MDNRFDIVKLIRKARLDNAAKADETDELKENLDFVSFGMISESEPQSNAPENTANIAPKGPAGQRSMYSANPSRKRTSGGQSNAIVKRPAMLQASTTTTVPLSVSGDHCLKSWARLGLNPLRLPYT
jgi:hypothetical protein